MATVDAALEPRLPTGRRRRVVRLHRGRRGAAQSQRRDAGRRAGDDGGRATRRRLVGHADRTWKALVEDSGEPMAGGCRRLDCQTMQRPCWDWQVLTLATAIVGKWKMDIDTKSFSTNEALCFSLKQPFYLLFNPWCRGESGHTDGEQEVQLKSTVDGPFRRPGVPGGREGARRVRAGRFGSDLARFAQSHAALRLELCPVRGRRPRLLPLPAEPRVAPHRRRTRRRHPHRPRRLGRRQYPHPST